MYKYLHCIGGTSEDFFVNSAPPIIIDRIADGRADKKSRFAARGLAHKTHRRTRSDISDVIYRLSILLYVYIVTYVRKHYRYVVITVR